MNIETRRKSARTKITSKEIVYLHFQTGNGAVVLDASPEGLGFQAADPLRPNESLPFRLSVPGFPEIALSGQIIWLDSTRKRGGMRLSVPAESVAIFAEWQRKFLDPAAETDEVPASAPAPAWASAPASRARVQARTEDPRPASASPAESPIPARMEDPAPDRPEPPRTSPPPPPNPFARRSDSMLGSHGPIFVSEWEMPPEPSRTGRNVLVALVILALGAFVAGGSYYLSGKRTVGNMLINLGRQISGATPQASTTPSSPNANSGAQGTPAPAVDTGSSTPLPQNPTAPNPAASSSPAAAPNVPPQPSTSALPEPQADSSGVNPAVAPPPSGAASQTPQKLDKNAAAADAGRSQPAQSAAGLGDSAVTDQHALDKPRVSKRPTSRMPGGDEIAPSADHGEQDLEQALQYLRGTNSQDSAVAAELLWSAVGKGNTQAELVLGGLYMRGQGAVHRNCRQAEVLLHAALAADVAGADEKIGELQTYGCR